MKSVNNVSISKKRIPMLNIQEYEPPFDYPRRVSINCKVYSVRYIGEKTMFYFEPGSPKSYNEKKLTLPNIPILAVHDALSQFENSNLMSVLNLEFFVNILEKNYKVNLISNTIDEINPNIYEHVERYDSFEDLIKTHPCLNFCLNGIN